MAHFADYSVVAWWATPVEIASALSRLSRLGEIISIKRLKADERARNVAADWTIVEPLSELRESASRLLNRYPLRAADSLQLAAALMWSGNDPRGHVFLTGDRRLHEAADSLGFISRLFGSQSIASTKP